MDYESFLQEARRYHEAASKGLKTRHQADLDLFLLLTDTYPQRLLWKKHYRTWRELLTQENLCPHSKFDRFNAGLKHLTQLEAKKFGPDAICIIGSFPANKRHALTVTLRKWEGKFNQPLSWDSYRVFLLEQRTLQGHSHIYASPARMQQYIDLLESKLTSNGIRLPKKPYSG